MTVRQYIQRRFRNYALVLVAVFFVGQVAGSVFTPLLPIAPIIAILAFALVSLYLINKFIGIKCPRCGKPLAPILLQAAVGFRMQRCPHCALNVDEEMPEGGNEQSEV